MNKLKKLIIDYFGDEVVYLKNTKYTTGQLAWLALEAYTLQNLAKELNCGVSTLKTKEPFLSCPKSTAPIGRRIAKLVGYTHCKQCNQYKPFEDFYRVKINDWCKVCIKDKNANRPKYLKDKKANAFYESKRRAAKLKRTPNWADLTKIKEIYKRCPEGHHVDHIIPLQGKLVSGLHTESNLQYLTASDNCRKSNFYEVD